MKKILALVAISLSTLSFSHQAKAESYIAAEMNQVLNRVSTLPLASAGGSARLKAAIVSDGMVGQVKWANGCRFSISDYQGGSSHYWGDTKWMNLRAKVSSTCLSESPLRLFVDVTYSIKTGRIETASVYARNGKTNYVLASCGRTATLTSPGVTCE